MTHSDSSGDPPPDQCDGCTLETDLAGTDSAETSAPLPSDASLPLQTITPRNPTSPNLQSSDANCAVDGNEFWSTVWYFKVRPIEFTLNSDERRSVTLSLVMRTCLPFASAVVVLVNGRVLRTYHPSNDSWFTQHITIPADFIEPGENHIALQTPATAQTRLGIPLGIWVQSASVGWNPELQQH
jgi:hypothetical protein